MTDYDANFVKHSQIKQFINDKYCDFDCLERMTLVMSSLLEHFNDYLNDYTVLCSETIGTVEREIENKQLEMDRMKERVARLRTIIQQKKNHLSHLKRLKKRR